ncbi:MAG: sugar nucleotide-binding protein, partial [Gemmatimonadetes bacterium]|nr:sugar nucleotide-binding protein [Gemmatimonadota bacterium]
VVVSDQVMSPTATADLARALGELVTTDAYGTYHVTSGGACSYFDFARTIFQKTGIETAVKPTSTESYGAPAARPLYTVLDNGRIRSLGIAAIPPWEDALDGYLARRAGHGEEAIGRIP